MQVSHAATVYIATQFSQSKHIFSTSIHPFQAKTNIRAMNLFVALRRATKQIFQFWRLRASLMKILGDSQRV